MDIFLRDPNEIPLPPEEMHILAVRAEPYPDGRRVRVTIEVTPFQQRPSLEVTALNPGGQVLAETSIIETLTRTLEFTLHLRGAQPGDECRLKTVLFMDPVLPPKTDQPEAGEQPGAAAAEAPAAPRPAPLILDEREIRFTTPTGQA